MIDCGIYTTANIATDGTITLEPHHFTKMKQCGYDLDNMTINQLPQSKQITTRFTNYEDLSQLMPTHQEILRFLIVRAMNAIEHSTTTIVIHAGTEIAAFRFQRFQNYSTSKAVRVDFISSRPSSKL